MSKTILCADDSATMQTVAEITFRASDYEYVGARSADEALSKAKANKPALILADAVMPGKDGYALCQEIKSDPSLADVPVVMLCGKSQVYDQAKGSQVGADGHFTKPWDSQVMIDKVAEVLAKVASGGSASASATAAAAAPAPIAAAPPPKPAPPAPPMPNPAVAARSATIMGMPTIQMPPKGLGVAGPATPLGTKPASIRPPTPATKPAPPAPAPAPAPRSPVSTPARGTPVVAKASLPNPPEGLDRPPLVKGAPKKRPPVPQRPVATLAARVASKLPSAAEQIALETGLDPKGPEIAALVKVTHEVIERIVWEVVPELAEAMIRENLADLTRNRS